MNKSVIMILSVFAVLILASCATATPAAPPVPVPVCGTPIPTSLSGEKFPQPDESCLARLQTVTKEDFNDPCHGNPDWSTYEDGRFFVHYRVQKGDNLYRIAVLYNTTPDTIMTDNPGLSEPPPVNRCLRIRANSYI